jgi:aspartyl-tRNA(Asn)/glutamyl-tRNA(Gln) amidotransferase subunit A
VSLRQGSAVVALGTDTAGSVRVPASLTGNAGYKSTIDRWPTAGIVPLSRYFDTPGVLARTVEDAHVVASEFDRRVRPGAADAIGDAKPVSGLRIGVPGGHFWDVCEESIATRVRAALGQLEKAGHKLVPIDFAEATAAFDLWNAGGTVAAELNAFLTAELPDWIARLDPNVGRRMQMAAGIAPEEVLARKAAFDALADKAARHFSTVDVIATPTVPCPPPTMEEVGDLDGYRAHNLRLLRNTHTANLLKLCAITLPVGPDALGLPVGLQLMGANMADARLFAAALAVEKSLAA